MARASTLLLLVALPLAWSIQVNTAGEPEEKDVTPSGFENQVSDPRYWTVTGPAAGDPKLQNMNGKRFQLHRPGEFTLLKVPNNKKHKGSLLEVTAEVKPLEIGDPCLLFIKKITVTGAWLGGSSMKVRAEEMGADFAVRVDHPRHEGAWRAFKNMTGWEEAFHKDEGTGLATTVKAVIGRREGRMEDIKGPFEHRFLIRLGKDNQKDKRTTIDIAMPKPGSKYLTLKVEHLRSLKEPNIQGLLGLESHDDLIVRDECKDAPGQVAASELLRVSGGLSRASAHWD